MNIFSEFEGLSGENLSSAILHYLLLNSEEVREVFIDYLSEHSPMGVITSYQHFSARKEYPTRDEHYGPGRLDLLIQVDNFAIGIENKFHASFQNGQPEKYQATLATTAQLLADINQNQVQPLLVILCPKYKLSEARAKAKLNARNTAVITWEGVLKQLKTINTVLNPVASVVLEEFKKYLNDQFSFMPSYTKKYPHFRKEFPESGTALQQELVAIIWSLFPEPYSRLSRGKHWVGYYFHNNPDEGQLGWFGFIPNSSFIDGVPNQAELVIAITYEIDIPHDGLVPVVLKDKNFLGRKRPYHAYRVDFNESWNTFSVWRDKLAPLTSGIGNTN